MLLLYCVINCIISSDYTDSAVVYLKRFLHMYIAISMVFNFEK